MKMFTNTPFLSDYQKRLSEKSSNSVSKSVGLTIIYATLILLFTYYLTHVGMLTHYQIHKFLNFPEAFIVFSLSIIPSIWLNYNITTPSDIVIWSIYLIVFIPTSIILLLIIPMVDYFIFYPSMLFGFFVVSYQRNTKIQLQPTLVTNKYIFWGTIVFMTLLFFSFFISILDIPSYFPTTPSEIREARMGFRTDVAQLGGEVSNLVMGRGLPIIHYTILPYIFTISIVKKKMAYLPIPIFGWILIFFQTGLRSALALPLSITVWYFLWKFHNNTTQKIIESILLLASLLILFTITFHYIFELDRILIQVRRITLVPGILVSYYVSFFSSNPHVYILSRSLGFYPYEISHTFLVGEVYSGRTSVNAVSNFVGSGFARSGGIGIIIYSIILRLALEVYDAVTRYTDTFTSTMCIVPFILPITNSDLLTVFISHGFLLMIIIHYLSPYSPGPISTEKYN